MTDSSRFAPEGYSLVRVIGRGASSVVWEAHVLATAQPVALKVFDAVSGPARYLERERAATVARHRNILTVLDAGMRDGRPWLATELCRRGSLAGYVADSGPLDVPTALRVLARLADALAAAHDAGVVHCDVEPANVLVTDEGEPALGDFGIARVSVERAATTTVDGFSLDHVAPELLDDGERSPRSDVYSLGTTVWELLVGHPPFRLGDDASVGTVLTRIMRLPLPGSDRIPDDVLALLRAMSAKDPGGRPASMAEVAAAVGALARERGIELDEPPLPPLTAVRRRVVEALSDAGEPGSAARTWVPADADAPTAFLAQQTWVPAEADAPTELVARAGVLVPADAWSKPLPPEQVLTFVPVGSAPYAPWTADPDEAPVHTTRVPFRPRVDDDDEPARRRRLPLVAASVLAVLITVAAAFGIQQGRENRADAPVAITPAALVPSTTPPPEPTATSSPSATPSPSATRRPRATTTTPRTTTVRPTTPVTRTAPRPVVNVPTTTEPAPAPPPTTSRPDPTEDPVPDPDPGTGNPDSGNPDSGDPDSGDPNPEVPATGA